MCAEKKKEERSEAGSTEAGCNSENFAGMFEKMKECCGSEEKMSSCCEKMKSIMSARCGTVEKGTSKEGGCS